MPWSAIHKSLFSLFGVQDIPHCAVVLKKGETTLCATDVLVSMELLIEIELKIMMIKTWVSLLLCMIVEIQATRSDNVEKRKEFSAKIGSTIKDNGTIGGTKEYNKKNYGQRQTSGADRRLPV